MLIRHATISDAPAMGKVMVETFMQTHKKNMPDEAWHKRAREWTPEISARGWIETLQDIDKAAKAGKTPNDCLYLAIDEAATLNNGVVALAYGYMSHTQGMAEIGSIYVSPSHQGRGLGRRLMRAVARHMADIGCTSLQLGVLAANKSARRFYEAIGGQFVAERTFNEEGFLLPEAVYCWSDIQMLAQERTQ